MPILDFGNFSMKRGRGENKTRKRTNRGRRRGGGRGEGGRWWEGEEEVVVVVKPEFDEENCGPEKRGRRKRKRRRRRNLRRAESDPLCRHRWTLRLSRYQNITDGFSRKRLLASYRRRPPVKKHQL